MKETQSCRSKLSDCRGENLEAREDSEGVEMVSAELLCSKKKLLANVFLGLYV